MKIRLLYVVESFATGVYSVIHDIATNLNPKEFEVKIIYSLRVETPADYEQEFAQHNIDLVHIPMGSAKYYLSAIKKIKHVVAQYQPDVIHLHSSKAGFLGRLVTRKAKAQLFYSPHGFSFLRTDVNALSKRLFFYLEKGISRYRKSTFITVSAGEATQAQRLGTDVQIINNFIDSSQIIPQAENEELFVAICGRITPARNPELFNAIAQRMPQVHFKWIGDGEERAKLTAPNIEVTGYLSRKEVLKILPSAAVYVQTSLWEGMPVAVLEAMSAAKPIVASNIIGNRDLIVSGSTGILCDPHDVDGFISHIEKLLASQEMRIRLGNAAREYVIENHDLHKAVTAYEELYRQQSLK